MEKKEIIFHKLITKVTEKLKNLDDDEKIMFERRLPSEIEKFPPIRLGIDKAYHALNLKIGAKPVSGEMVLLPIWSLKVQHKTNRRRRTITMDAATGRLVTGDYKSD